VIDGKEGATCVNKWRAAWVGGGVGGDAYQYQTLEQERNARSQVGRDELFGAAQFHGFRRGIGTRLNCATEATCGSRRCDAAWHLHTAQSRVGPVLLDGCRVHPRPSRRTREAASRSRPVLFFHGPASSRSGPCSKDGGVV
jgi:hypothetical protein